MLLRIDVNSEETLYSQLSNQIKYGIAKGYLLPGESLPSVRGLASELGINMHTVSKVYSLLKDEGIIVINRSKGVKVSDNVLIKRNDSYSQKFDKKMTELVAEGLCNGIDKVQFLDKANQVFKKIGGQ